MTSRPYRSIVVLASSILAVVLTSGCVLLVLPIVDAALENARLSAERKAFTKAVEDYVRPLLPPAPPGGPTAVVNVTYTRDGLALDAVGDFTLTQARRVVGAVRFHEAWHNFYPVNCSVYRLDGGQKQLVLAQTVDLIAEIRQAVAAALPSAARKTLHVYHDPWVAPNVCKIMFRADLTIAETEDFFRVVRRIHAAPPRKPTFEVDVSPGQGEV